MNKTSTARVLEDLILVMTTIDASTMSLVEHKMKEAAANKILDMAMECNRPFPDAALKKLHKLLFDCSDTVRISLVKAIFCAGNHSSVKWLQALLLRDTETEEVRDAAEVAILKCYQRGMRFKEVPMSMPAVSLVTSDINLSIRLNRETKKADCRLVFPEPSTSDLFVFPATVRLVNRRVLGLAGWHSFIRLMEDMARPISKEFQKVLCEESINTNDLMSGELALILTDGFSPEEEAAWGHLPTTDMQVYRAEEWMVDWIIEKVCKLLKIEHRRDIDDTISRIVP